MERTLFRSLLPAVSAGILLFFAGCASTPKHDELPPAKTTEPPPAETPVVSLFVPEQEERPYFSFPDETIVQDMEIGSPVSLHSAAAKLRKSSTAYSEQEKIALMVASAIMSMVWPSEQNTIEVPSGNIEANPYTAAIESAKIGIYDVNTGQSDFFTLVLPCLVIVTPYADTGYYHMAQQALTTALQINENSVLARYLLGRLYLRMEKPDDALPLFQAAVKASPSCLETQYELARTYLLLDETYTAFELAKSLLKTFPRNLPLLKLCTEAALSQGDFAAAEEYIAQVLQQEPENTQYLLYRIRVLVEQENYIKAVPLLDAYARTDKSSRDYLLLRARIQQEWNKNSVAAAATLEEALVLYPDDFNVILAAAQLAANSGGVVRGKSAGQFAQEILNRAPNNLQALEICMDDAILQKNWQQAYKYSSVLMEQPDRTLDTILSHINICLNLNRLGEARNLADELYTSNPTSDEIREIYTRVLAAEGKRAEVLELIQKLLPDASAKLKSFLYYQRSLFASSDTERLSDLRQSLTANPRNREPLFELYRYYYDKQDYRKAQYYLKQVVALNSSDQEILQLNAELDELLGN